MTAKQKKDLLIAILIIGLFLYLWNKAVEEKKGENDYDKRMEEEFSKQDSLK